MVSDKKIFKVFYIAIKPYPLMAVFFWGGQGGGGGGGGLTNHDSLNKLGRG